MPRLGTVVVLHHPDADTIDHVEWLADRGFAPIAVVNAATEDWRDRLRRSPGVLLVENLDNLGLARAFNQGIEQALARGDDYVLLFDQDSRPPPDFARAMLIAATDFSPAAALGCVGPTVIDRKRPDAGVVRPGSSLGPGLRTALTVISSGMLIPRTAIDQVGGMWEPLFIDGIDHEWCFRAAAAGLTVAVATNVVLPHDMGDDAMTLFGRYKPIHRSPFRHYHIVRNTLWLARRSVIPTQWRLTETLKLALRAPAYLVFSSARIETVKALWRGVRDGLRPPEGPNLPP